jgi:hypothetical protein
MKVLFTSHALTRMVDGGPPPRPSIAARLTAYPLFTRGLSEWLRELWRRIGEVIDDASVPVAEPTPVPVEVPVGVRRRRRAS